MEYIATKFELPAHWVGADIKSKAKISEYLHYHHTHLRNGYGAFFKTFFADLENPNVDTELQAIEDALKHIETHSLKNSKLIGGDEVSIADLQICAELNQSAAGRLLHDLFDFPKTAVLMSEVSKLPGFKVVFKELTEFSESLPPVKSAQVTIRGNREILKNLRGARPKRRTKNSK